MVFSCRHLFDAVCFNIMHLASDDRLPRNNYGDRGVNLNDRNLNTIEEGVCEPNNSIESSC
jgi:hypothetical protein